MRYVQSECRLSIAVCSTSSTRDNESRQVPPFVCTAYHRVCVCVHLTVQRDEHDAVIGLKSGFSVKPEYMHELL